LVSMESA